MGHGIVPELVGVKVNGGQALDSTHQGLRGGLQQNLLVEYILHVVEGVVVIQILRQSNVRAHGVLVFIDHAAADVPHHQTDIGIVADGPAHLHIHLFELGAVQRHLDRVDPEQVVQFGDPEVFRHGIAGNHGIVVKISDNSIVLIAFISIGIGHSRQRAMVVEIGIHHRCQAA